MNSQANCLVIQLSYLGEIYQSLMALKAVKQLYPEVSLSILVREEYADLMRRVDWIDAVYGVPVSEFTEPVISGKETNSQAIKRLAKWLAPLVNDPWSFLVNWSYNEASSYLAALIPSYVKLGYSRRGDVSFECSDDWSAYLNSILVGEVEQNIHLTDILTTQLLTNFQLHIGEPENISDSPVTSKRFFRVDDSSSHFIWNSKRAMKKWVAIHIGDGRRDDEWSVEHWARLTYQILKKHSDFNVFVFGHKRDRLLEKAYFAELESYGVDTKRICSLVGKTDLDMQISAVARCQWVIATDLSLIHLASVVGTRVLHVCLDRRTYISNGPYGNGHYVISAEGRPEGINAELVYGVWSYALQEWIHQRELTLEHHMQNVAKNSLLKGLGIYRARIRPSHEGGGVYYEPMLGTPMTIEQWTATVVGQVARSWFCGWVAPAGQDLVREAIFPKLLNRLRKVEEQLVKLKLHCETGIALCTELAEKSSKLKSDRVMGVKDQEELNRLATEIEKVQASIESIGSFNAPLRVFAEILRIMMHNIPGERLADLSIATADTYRKIYEGIEIYENWVKKTFEMAKPVAIAQKEL